MATALYSFRKQSNGRIMFHGFLAGNADQATKDMEAHANACPQFGPALKAGSTLEIEVEVDELPEFEEESLEEFLELDSDDDDDDEPEEDEDEEPEEEGDEDEQG